MNDKKKVQYTPNYDNNKTTPVDEIHLASV